MADPKKPLPLPESPSPAAPDLSVFADSPPAHDPPAKPTPAQLRGHAAALQDEWHKVEAGAPDADPDELWRLHYLANGQPIPRP